MTTNTTAATFTQDSLTINGQTFAASYSVTPSGTVYAFVTVQEGGKDVNMRIKITADDPNYAAALTAAQHEQATQPATQETPAQEAAQPAQETPAQEAAQPAQDTPAQEAAQPAQETPAQEAAQPIAQEQEREPKQVRGLVPEKTFVGQEITGNGWRIVFDGANERTRVIFTNEPSKAAQEAITNAGFYWSPLLKSFNKKLTFKAHRAAQALAQQLATLYA